MVSFIADLVTGIAHTSRTIPIIVRDAFASRYALPKQMADANLPVDAAGHSFSLLLLSSLLFAGLVPIWLFLRSRSLLTRLLCTWLWVDAAIHLALEQSFLMLSLLGTKTLPWSLFLETWKEYGRADARWAQALDAVPVSLEVLTVYVVGPLCLLLIYARLTRAPWYHFVQIVAATCELYGGWMTFAPEWLTKNKALMTGGYEAKLFWSYLVLANTVWIVVPVLQLWHSYVVVTRALTKNNDSAASLQQKAPRSPRRK